MPGEAAPQVEAKERDAAGPVPAGPGFAAPSFDSTGARSHEQAILNLQRTAGNRAVASLFSGIQRAPDDAPVMLGPSASPELNGQSVNPNSLTGGVLMGKYAPPPPKTVEPKSQLGRPQDGMAALTGTATDTFAAPIGTIDPDELTYTQAVGELQALAGWLKKRRKSTAEDNPVHERMAALNHRIDVLIRPGRPAGGAKVPKPWTLTGGIDFQRLTDEEANRELDNIVAYIHQQTPTKEERKKLAAALDILEDRVERQTSRVAGDVRRRDIELALTSTKGSPHEQFADVLAKIERIPGDPERPGMYLLANGQVNVSLTADEYAQIKRAGRRMVSEYTRSAEEVLDNAYQAYTDRVDRAIEHPIVHALVGLTSGAEDLDYMEMFVQHELGLRQVMDISQAAMGGNVQAALRQAFAFEQYARDYAKRIAKWEETLISSAKHWAIALIVLKEALTIVATGGAAGLMAFKLAQGISFVKATLQITGGLATAGAVGAGTVSAGAQYATEGKVGAGKTFADTRRGAGTGTSIAISSMAAPIKEATGVAKATTAIGRYGGNAVVDTAVTETANVAGALISNDDVGDAAKAGLSAPVTSVAGTAGTKWAGASKLKQTVAGAGAGGTGNLVGAAASGKDAEGTLIEVGKGVIGGAATPHIAGASKARNERKAAAAATPTPTPTPQPSSTPAPPPTATGRGGSGGAGAGTTGSSGANGGPVTKQGVGAAGPAGIGAGPRTSLGVGAPGAAGENAGPAIGTTPLRPGQGPGGTQVGVPAGPKAGQGPGGTQVGVPEGPTTGRGPGGTQIGIAEGPTGGGAPGTPVEAPFAAGQKLPGRAGRSGRGARSGHAASKHAPGKSGFWKDLKAPDGPPPGPPRNEVYKMQPHEAETSFGMNPEKVTVNDSTDFHQYRWDVARWNDGQPKSPAPMVFRVPDGGGHIMVDGERWRAAGLDPTKILKQ